MKIGVWVDQPVNKSSGGSYTYITTLLSAIDDYNFNPDMDLCFVSINQDCLSDFNKPVIYLKPHQKGIWLITKLIRKGLKIIAEQKFSFLINTIDQKERKIKDASTTAYLCQQGIKVIFFPAPSSQIIKGIPYILNNWDLAHYTTYAFPEITDDNGFERRNSWYKEVLPSALMLFCETEAGKKEIAQYLSFNPAKIRVLPIFPSNLLKVISLTADKQLDVLRCFNLKEQEFFFYPAQFWAHKNHFTLIKAFKKFHQQHPGFRLLLCGSDKGNERYIKNYVESSGLQTHVIFTGFIDDVSLWTLFKHAKALVMPTLLGPSNIPPLEAMQLSCPVLCSDFEGHREMLANGALYFDPLNDLSILNSMQMIMDDSIRQQIVNAQKEQAKVTLHCVEKALMKLDQHLVEALNIRSCWE